MPSGHPERRPRGQHDREQRPDAGLRGRCSERNDREWRHAPHFGRRHREQHRDERRGRRILYYRRRRYKHVRRWHFLQPGSLRQRYSVRDRLRRRHSEHRHGERRTADPRRRHGKRCNPRGRHVPCFKRRHREYHDDDRWHGKRLRRRPDLRRDRHGRHGAVPGGRHAGRSVHGHGERGRLHGIRQCGCVRHHEYDARSRGGIERSVLHLGRSVLHANGLRHSGGGRLCALQGGSGIPRRDHGSEPVRRNPRHAHGREHRVPQQPVLHPARDGQRAEPDDLERSSGADVGSGDGLRE